MHGRRSSGRRQVNTLRRYTCNTSMGDLYAWLAGWQLMSLLIEAIEMYHIDGGTCMHCRRSSDQQVNTLRLYTCDTLMGGFVCMVGRLTINVIALIEAIEM